MDDGEIKSILMNHEKRITSLEVSLKDMDGWMKSIDHRLNKIEEDVAYMKGRLSKINNNGNGMNKNQLITIIGMQAGTLATMLAIIVKILGG